MMKANRTAGFSILELMIALLLGVVVVAGIVQLFAGNSRTYDIINAQSRLQENARFAFEFISVAARSAGYYGCAPETRNIAKGLNGNWGEIPEYNMSQAVTGFESLGGAYAPNNLLTLPRDDLGNVHTAGNGIETADLVPEADILVFNGVRLPVATLAQQADPLDDPVAYTPGGQPEFNGNDVVVLSDCDQAALFRVTAVNAAGDQTTLLRNTVAGGGNFDNGDQIATQGDPDDQGVAVEVVPATLSINGQPYGPESTLSVMQSTIFFIAPSTQNNNRNAVVNALWRKVGSDQPRELIQGVDDMQVLYGVDRDNVDLTPEVNQYVTIDAVADARDIVAVRVRLDLNSVDELADIGDQLRRTFTKTIFVRNAKG